jgi:hypothetical protein
LQFEKYEPKTCDPEEEPEKDGAINVQRSDEDLDNHVLQSCLVLSLKHWPVRKHA